LEVETIKPENITSPLRIQHFERFPPPSLKDPRRGSSQTLDFSPTDSNGCSKINYSAQKWRHLWRAKDRNPILFRCNRESQLADVPHLILIIRCRQVMWPDKNPPRDADYEERDRLICSIKWYVM
jgi:hypothetical protein